MSWLSQYGQQHQRQEVPATIRLEFKTLAVLCVAFFVAGLIFGIAT